MRLNNERGNALITVVLLMLVVTLLGIIAIDTATVDVQIASNLRQATTEFEAAEGGIDLVVPIIEQSASSQVLTPSAALLTATTDSDGNPKPAGTILIDSIGSNFQDEVVGNTRMDADGTTCEDLNGNGVLDAGEDTNGNGQLDPDICINQFGDSNIQVGIDVDALLSTANPGSSLEFASGYEGIGAGAAGGGMSLLYRISSQGFRQ